MAQITAALVKELRDKTNAGMMDCKSALSEAEGDLSLAEDILRKKGIAKAGKKASRDANEGVISAAIVDGDKVGALAEINCETDFVAKNENFASFVAELTENIAAADGSSPEEILAGPKGDSNVEEFIKVKMAELGENLILRRFERYEVQGEGIAASYIHLAGKVGVLVEAGCTKPETASADAFKELVKDITLHIAATDPTCLSSDEVPEDIIAKEKEIYAEQMKDKPDNVIEKIIAGKLQKFFGEICLLEQGFVKDPDTTVSKLLKQKSEELGDEITIRRYTRYGIGEEI